MKVSRSKILFIVSDVLIAVYLLLAFSSFDKKGGNQTLCNKVNINIADNATSGFIDAKIIKNRLQKSGVYPMGKEMRHVDTRRIEEMLIKSPFVNTAECYKTEGGHVYISVTQRMPVIRIKADNGDDYYVDDNDCVMPTTRYTSDLIIATGSINRWFATNFISPLGKVIMANEMWKNLIEQINVLPNQSIELVPRIGDHVVHIGKLPEGKGRADRLAAIQKFMDVKMTRLEKFYKYGLSVVGWNKYSYVDMEFDNQIICRKKSSKHASLETTMYATPTVPEPQPQSENAETSEEKKEPTADNPAKPETDKPEKAKAEKAKSEKAKPEKAKAEKKEQSAKQDKAKKSEKTAKSKDGKTEKKKSSNKR